jgi:hypothetical protein
MPAMQRGCNDECEGCEIKCYWVNGTKKKNNIVRILIMEYLNVLQMQQNEWIFSLSVVESIRHEKSLKNGFYFFPKP